MNDYVRTADAADVASTAFVKCPTRIICYAWGNDYVDLLLTLTLPSLLAPGNLPFVAAEVPCELIILTERRFFSKLNTHPVIAEIRKHCPVRMIRLDDLIASKDKYGMSLTYVLHRGFSDLGAEMKNQWQIFLNADFILADGSLRSIVAKLARGERIVASPSYCANAEETIPQLRKWLDPSNLTLCIPHRELARIILLHRHTVIRGKTVNQQQFHMRYMDQFYWEVDDDTLIGFQMPVAIVGLHPERCVAEPNSYWDYGLIWEYCPNAGVCVLGDSDEFTMLELRDKSVAEDQIIAGPPNLSEIAERMIVWVTPYQSYFLKFPLTLHDRDLPSNIDEGRHKIRSFTDEVISLAPTLPSHLEHPQWEYHRAKFNENRSKLRRTYRKILVTFLAVYSRVMVDTKRALKTIFRPFAIPIFNRIVVPLLRRRGLQIAEIVNLIDLQNKAERLKQAEHVIETILAELSTKEAHLTQREAQITSLKTDLSAKEAYLTQEKAQITSLRAELSAKNTTVSELTDRAFEQKNIATEYQFKLERSYDYQSIMAQDQIRQGVSQLEPEFQAFYENCRQYTMTSWERLYALYKSVRYVVENSIPGDLVECGVWRGGSMKLAAHVLLALGVTDRTLFLYDTFEGMTKPDPSVDLDFSGNNAINDWNEIQRRSVKWSYAPLEEVRETMAQVGYPMDHIRLVKGPVEETIPGTLPNKIALLRLDTDWYASTKHEMNYLYPLLSPEGILILDDYGHYQGAARAADEYFANGRRKPLLQRVDYSCRAAIKPVA